jgi:hypothetical protein
MTLFDDDAAGEFQRAVTLVEQAIADLGLDPVQCRQAEGRQDAGERSYALRRGRASTFVGLTAAHAPGESGRLRLLAPVVSLPQQEVPGLYLRLLELNARDLTGVAFGVQSGQVVVVSERACRDLDPSEVDSLIRTVGRVADKFDGILAAEFGLEGVS